jgi:membrane fusion protein (multidrug efflux system)
MADQPKLFRVEAVEHQVAQNARADVLHVDPAATAWGFRLCLAALVTVLAFLILGRLNEYASGPAVVRLEGRSTLSAHSAAFVSKVHVIPGAKVHEGDVLVQFYSSSEAAELAAAGREFDDQLRKLLQQPQDATAREALVSLRTRRDLAQQRLDERTLRAPFDGVIGDVRVRAGQAVEAGTSVLELVDAGSSASLTALLPGRYRPFLTPGKKLRFQLDGFNKRAQELIITNVGDQIVGPSEAARYLGRDLADSLRIEGPVVLVQAQLPSATFESDDDGKRLSFAHGMQGRAESAVRNEPIAYAFVPALKQWVEQVRPGALLERLGLKSRAEPLSLQEPLPN